MTDETVLYEIDGDVAHAETYWFYGAKNRDGSNWLAGGRYLDRLERRDGAWRIVHEHLSPSRG